LKSIAQSGLAAYLIAAPLLERKLLTGRHVAGEPECPEGVAVVYAAIDWARCGRTDPISEKTLRKLWPSYLLAGMRPADDGFKAGSDWTLRHVAGTIALLEQHDGGYRPYDYIVRFSRNRPGAQLPSDAAWTSSTQGVSDAKALAVGESAYQHGRYDNAITAFEIASRSSTNEVAAIAHFNLGTALAGLNRLEEALTVYGEVVARYGEEPEPALRETTAKALFYKGTTFARLDRLEDEVAAYEEVLARFGEEPEPALRETIASVLFYKGVRLGAVGRSEEALAAYEEVVARFGEEPELALREQVAKALFNKGASLDAVGRSEEALTAYEEVVARFGEESGSALRETIAKALLYKGITLAQLDRLEEALAVLEEVLARYGEDPTPELRTEIACALVSKGTTLTLLDRSEEALAVYEEIVARFGEEPALREPVAYAREELAISRGEAR
jgi:tetratricopeptide (TPR) repeat protein